MKFQSLFAVLVLIAVAAAKNPPAPPVIKLHGSTSVTYMLIQPNKDEIEKKAGCKLDIASNGSGNGLTDLALGRADVAMISAPLDEVAAKVNAQTPGTIDASKMQAAQVGEASVAFVVHDSNPVKKLTIDQISNILTGGIKNWKEVGGKDAPIIVFVPRSGDGVRTVVEEKVLSKSASFVESRRELNNPVLVAEAMSQFPNAIGIVSKFTKKPSTIVALETDKDISQPLYMVTNGSPSQDIQKFIDVVQSLDKK